jgi:hypothetical protein
MKTHFRLILILLTFLPVLSFGQNIDVNLKYINEQFGLYNSYGTIFSVDTRTKEIICEDEFGILKANFSDVEIRENSGNISIFCLNENSKCIRYYGKDGTRLYDQDYSDYTMGLKKNDKMIPHINTVLAKFAELKGLVASSATYSTSDNDGSSKLGKNLKYINEQFSLYNGYETSFSIDMKSKEIICEDKFGILKANWRDVEIRVKDNNIGIFCLNENSACIRSYKKNGERNTSDQKEYTMGLRENDKIILHINSVLSKFSEIKSIVLNGGGAGVVTTNDTDVKAKVESELRIINQIFQRSSEYKNVYSVDYATKKIIAKTESCKAIVPVKSGLTLNYYKRDSDYGEGFYFENSDKSILESCTSFEDYTEKTYEYVSNYEDVQIVIRSLNKITNLLQNSSTTTTVSYGTTSGNAGDLLRYINEQFSKYNAYNTVYAVDYASKKLMWTNDFGTNTVDFNQVEIRVDYENNWIGVYCLSGNKCIAQVTTSRSTAYYDKYTMSLIENGKMIGHIDEVVKKFAALKQAVVNGSRPTTSNGGASNDDPDSPDK